MVHMVLKLKPIDDDHHQSNTLQFEASECTITCGQQLALPRLNVCMQSLEGPPREVHFLWKEQEFAFLVVSHLERFPLQATIKA